MKLLFLIFFLTLNVTVAFGVEPSDIKYIVESNGYIYDDNASGIKKLSSGAKVLRVFSKSKESKQYQSVLVTVDDDGLTPVGKPVWAGGGINIDAQDIDSNGRDDLIVSEYYEPDLHVRIFLNVNKDKYSKVFEGISSSKPVVIDLIPNGAREVKELILTTDPYGFSLDALFVPQFYFYDGDSFVLRKP